MAYAIIKIYGKQYKIKEGDTIEVDATLDKDQKTVAIDKVLLYSDGENLLIGSPFLNGVKVEALNEGSIRGPKIDVMKFKAKSRFVRKTGSRSRMTQLKINKISVSKEAAPKSEEPKTETKPRKQRKKKTE